MHTIKHEYMCALVSEEAKSTAGLRGGNGNGSGSASSEEDAGNEGVKLIWWFAFVRTGAESTLGRRPSRFSSSADEALRRATF